MRIIQSITCKFLPAVLVIGCGTSKPAIEPSSGAEDNSLAGLTRDAAAAYADGDCTAFQQFLNTAINKLDASKGFTEPSEKLQYLDSAFPSLDGIPYKQLIESCQNIVEVIEPPEIVPASWTVSPPDLPEYREEATLDVHGIIRDELIKLFLSVEGHPEPNIHDDFVEDIARYIHLFQHNERYRALFERSLRRSRKYIPAVRPYFEEKGLPESLIFGIATVESGFNPAATSRVGARGLFQFMPATGRERGLRITRSLDERTSPVKSAVACSEYFIDLLMELGDLGLALSAYNGGPGRIRRALRNLDDFRDRNFWALRERTDILPRETQNYVSQIYAAIVLSSPENLRRFGFETPPSLDPDAYRMVLVPRPMRLSELADLAGTNVHTLYLLNLDLEPDASRTPGDVVDYPIFVPVQNEGRLLAALYGSGSSSPIRLASDTASETTASTSVRYVVQRGNTLSQIASSFGKSVRDIRRWNPQLQKRGLWAGETIVIQDLSPGWQKVNHTVRRGETLSSIARQYGVKVSHIVGWNGLRSDRIRSGSRLVIYTDNAGNRRS